MYLLSTTFWWIRRRTSSLYGEIFWRFTEIYLTRRQ